QQIQDAKDELLALASHQLRTPATGVKMYIAMMRDGYAGKLTKEQQRLLDKAYRSNERQLAIINELLFVARADADHLTMKLEQINLSRLIKNVLVDEEPAVHHKKLKFNLSLPLKDILIEGDKQYLRMAVGNVISNSIKYTRDGGKITVTLNEAKGK